MYNVNSNTPTAWKSVSIILFLQMKNCMYAKNLEKPTVQKFLLKASTILLGYIIVCVVKTLAVN